MNSHARQGDSEANNYDFISCSALSAASDPMGTSHKMIEGPEASEMVQTTLVYLLFLFAAFFSCFLIKICFSLSHVTHDVLFDVFQSFPTPRLILVFVHCFSFFYFLSYRTPRFPLPFISLLLLSHVVV